MTKRLLAIYLVLVILLMFLLPSCLPAPLGTGTIIVQARLCGVSWNGTVQYTLTAPGGSYTLSNNSVPNSFDFQLVGDWTCGNVSGGPGGAHLDSIWASPSQTLLTGGNITFFLDFDLDHDAWIEFLTWTVSGDPVGEPGEPVYFDAVPCQTIDVHFQQGVDGCFARQVAMNETSKLDIHWTGYEGDYPGSAGIIAWVINDWCAVNKTPPATIYKMSQVASFNGTPVEKKYTWFEFPGICQNVTLDVETSWVVYQGLNYTKEINWFGISTAPFDPGNEHPCVLFELVLQAPGTYNFTMSSSAQVTLLDGVDIDPSNNNTSSSPLFLTVTWPGP